MKIVVAVPAVIPAFAGRDYSAKQGFDSSNPKEENVKERYPGYDCRG